jgi:serine/threonine protein kinase
METVMQICPTCGFTQNREGARFCSNCASPLAPAPVVCPRCGAQNPPGARFCSNCANALTSAPVASMTGLLAPNTFLQARYIITRKLGQGGMGAVYQAQDARLQGKLWAIKEMSDAQLTDPTERANAIASFRREAQLLATLDHTNLPKVADFFEEGGKQYLVMDFIEGQTLEQVVAATSGFLPEPTVLAWAEQLCDVLEYLHTRRPPIIFRDLKPANIMLTREGKIKLIDFGIARFFKAGKSKDTAKYGTIGYAAPEQFGTGQTDARSDIFSLGVTIHALLTQYDPSQSPYNLPLARSMNLNTSPQTEAVINRATAMAPADRFQSALEMRKTIRGEVTVIDSTRPAPSPFRFRSGDEVRSVAELVRLCEAKPDDATWHLENGHFEPWLISIGQPGLAQSATAARQSTGTGAEQLKKFLDATGVPHTFTVATGTTGTVSAEPLIACEKCGRSDDSLRVTVFLYVISIIIMTFKRGWGGILCKNCRIKYGILFTVLSLLLGPWGFPWGIIYTLQAFFTNLFGGDQPAENNARLLAYQGVRFLERGDVVRAHSCLSASLALQNDPDIEALLNQVKPLVLQQVPSARVQVPGSAGHSSAWKWGLGLAAIGAVIFAVFFGLTTYNSSQASRPTPVSTVALPTSVAVVAPTVVPTATSQPIVPSTSTAVPTATSQPIVPSTSTAVPTATSRPIVAVTPTPRATATALPTATPTSVWLLADDFKDNRNGWYTDQDVYFENNSYHLYRRVGSGFSVWCDKCERWSDYAYEAMIQKVEGPDNLGYGLQFRRDNDDTYYLLISDGDYGLVKKNSGKGNHGCRLANASCD